MFTLLLAFLAGVVTIFAPCTLPLLPVVLGASLGRAMTARPLFIALGFAMSFGIVALALNAITKALDFDPNHLRNGAALMLVAFGLMMIWPSLFERLAVRLGGSMPALNFAGIDHGNLGGFLVGCALGLVWTPCAGPVLGAILTLVARSEDIAWASIQLLAYAVGAAAPMLVVAYGGQALTSRVRAIARYAPRLQRAFGVVIVATAVTTYLQYDTAVVAWLTRFYPAGLISI